MKKSIVFSLVFVCIAVILTAGCTSAGIQVAPDPIVGHWGGMADINYMSFDAYSNGTGTLLISNLMVGSMSTPVKWGKNPNGTYTMFTETPAILTISDDKLIIGDGEKNPPLLRGFTYTPPGK
ncbi:MAG: hypothetical protein WCH85_11140 [Methanomicrobiales archaeon]